MKDIIVLGVIDIWSELLQSSICFMSVSIVDGLLKLDVYGALYKILLINMTPISRQICTSEKVWFSMLVHLNFFTLGMDKLQLTGQNLG